MAGAPAAPAIAGTQGLGGIEPPCHLRLPLTAPSLLRSLPCWTLLPSEELLDEGLKSSGASYNAMSVTAGRSVVNASQGGRR